jgi:hypothetical protein
MKAVAHSESTFPPHSSLCNVSDYTMYSHKSGAIEHWTRLDIFKEVGGMMPLFLLIFESIL